MPCSETFPQELPFSFQESVFEHGPCFVCSCGWAPPIYLHQHWLGQFYTLLLQMVLSTMGSQSSVDFCPFQSSRSQKHNTTCCSYSEQPTLCCADLALKPNHNCSVPPSNLELQYEHASARSAVRYVHFWWLLSVTFTCTHSSSVSFCWKTCLSPNSNVSSKLLHRSVLFLYVLHILP